MTFFNGIEQPSIAYLNELQRQYHDEVFTDDIRPAQIAATIDPPGVRPPHPRECETDVRPEMQHHRVEEAELPLMRMRVAQAF